MQQLWKLFSLGISPGVFIDGNHISSQPHPSSLFYFLLRSQHTRSLLFHSSLSASFCTFNDSNCTYYFSLTDYTRISLLSTRTPKAYGAFRWLFAVTLWSASLPWIPSKLYWYCKVCWLFCITSIWSFTPFQSLYRHWAHFEEHSLKYYASLVTAPFF